MSVPVIEREAHANHSTKAPRLALARCGERTHRPLGMSIVVPPLPKKGHLLVPNPNGDRVVRLRSPRSSITSKQTKLLLKNTNAGKRDEFVVELGDFEAWGTQWENAQDQSERERRKGLVGILVGLGLMVAFVMLVLLFSVNQQEAIVRNQGFDDQAIWTLIGDEYN